MCYCMPFVLYINSITVDQGHVCGYLSVCHAVCQHDICRHGIVCSEKDHAELEKGGHLGRLKVFALPMTSRGDFSQKSHEAPCVRDNRHCFSK